jgi:hypothetical protein
MNLSKLRAASGILLRLGLLKVGIALAARGRRAEDSDEEKGREEPHPRSVGRPARLIKGRLAARRFC